MPPRRKRPASLRALGSALCLLLAVLLALGPVRPVWAAMGAGLATPVHQFTGEEPGDNAARASMALVQGPKAAADQKKEDAKAARENGWWVGGGAAAVVAGAVAIPAVVASLRASPVVARVVAAFTGAQADPRVRQAEQQGAQQGMRVLERVADAAKSTPQIVKGSNSEMLGQALQYVKALKGTAEQKAELFERLAPQINKLSGGSWSAARGVGTDGSHVFLGGAGEALVVNPLGQIFRGSLQNGSVSLAGPGIFNINPSLLKALE